MGAFVELIPDFFMSFDFVNDFVESFRDRHKRRKDRKNRKNGQ